MINEELQRRTGVMRVGLSGRIENVEMVWIHGENKGIVHSDVRGGWLERRPGTG